MSEERFRAPRVAINKVYTRGGDQGQTKLVGGQSRSKGALRIECYGTIDELNAVIKRCDLERFGSWRQGGQQDRKVFEGNDFLINIHIRGTRSASTVWVQGKRANEVNTRLLAARGA